LGGVIIKGLPPTVDGMRVTFEPGAAELTGQAITELLSVVEPGVPVSIRVSPRGLGWPGEYTVDFSISPDVGG
jgi:hypothetical protein